MINVIPLEWIALTTSSQFASECTPQWLSTYNLMSKTRKPLDSRCKPPPHFTVKHSVMLSSSRIFPQLEISSWEGGPHGAGCFMNNVLAAACLPLGWESAGLLCACDGRFWTFSTGPLDEAHPSSVKCSLQLSSLRSTVWHSANHSTKTLK